MAVSLHEPNVNGGSTTDTRYIKAVEITAFTEAVNAQFPFLVEEPLAPYQCLKASQGGRSSQGADLPKGNICIWRAKKGVHTVTLTGALTSLAF